MGSIPLIQRKHIWWPTLVGWLLLLLALLGAGCFAWRHVYGFLAPNEPAADARLLVVEGWMPRAELDQAVKIFRQGKYDRVVTSGGPIEEWWGATPQMASFAELAAHYLKTHGLEGVQIAAVPAPASAQERTYLSAVKVREWVARQEGAVKAIDVVSTGVHARRSRAMYRMAFGPEVEVGIFAARPSEYDAAQWWQSSAGAKSVVGESISLVWTALFFRPPEHGSHEETWGPRQPAEAAASPGKAGAG